MPEDSPTQKNQKQAMLGIFQKQQNLKNNVEKINNLKEYLSMLDLRRGTNWQRLFPWLDKDFV
jgi:hypothetical protein